MARTYNDIYYNDDENSTAEILDDMKKLAESVDQQIGSIKSFNNDTSQFIEQVTPLMNTLSEQVIDMHQLADTMFTELEQVKEENKQLREDLNGLPKGQASGESIDLNDSAEMRCELKISGNSKQETRSGKNYLNTFAKYKAGDTVTIEGITYIFNNDGSITCNGTATANSILDISQNIQTISGTNKKIIGFLTGSQVPSKIALVSYTRNYDTSTYLTFSEVNKSLQSKMKENKNYTLFRITVYSGTTVNNQTVYYQILDTSETDLTYEQYGVSPSPDYPSEVESCGDNGSINEVICNKNLFDKNTTTDGKLISSSGSIQIEPAGMCSDYIQIKTSANYYISGRTSLSSIALYDKNKTFLERISTTQPNGVLNITNSNCKYIIINALLTDKDTLQIEEGSTATSYIEHQSQSYTIPTQQPMRAIGDTRDEFILKENGKWYERHPIFRKIFTGNETFTLQSINDYGIANFDYKTGNTGYQVNGNILCNRFITQTAGISSIKTDGIYMNRGDVIFIRILASEIDTVEKLKTWLATLYTNGTPVYVDYVLEEPLDIECTEEQTEILNQIYIKAKSYKGVTHIYSTDKISSYKEVTYKKDIETLFANTLVEGV